MTFVRLSGFKKTTANGESPTVCNTMYVDEGSVTIQVSYGRLAQITAVFIPLSLPSKKASKVRILIGATRLADKLRVFGDAVVVGVLTIRVNGRMQLSAISQRSTEALFMSPPDLILRTFLQQMG